MTDQQRTHIIALMVRCGYNLDKLQQVQALVDFDPEYVAQQTIEVDKKLVDIIIEFRQLGDELLNS